MTTTAKRNGSTRRWRQTRARMLRQLPAICRICGTYITDSAHADIDHIVPVQYGGTDDPANLRLTHARCNRGRRVKRVAHAVIEGPVVRRPTPPHWRVEYPAHWPPDPDPDNTVVSWSRHWFRLGQFNPRCGACRELGRACADADPPDLAA